ncbi:hypothetical protein ANN_20634 [Periplaneta americana]|uniref:Uncharacterized protein n=1 Tax=Periplaneta americana TaxID=6978 RepID=A0ABQ8SDX3_PERAM|nr:hypothetical protein ANN_20634 [Periplaneta americana]
MTLEFQQRRSRDANIGKRNETVRNVTTVFSVKESTVLQNTSSICGNNFCPEYRRHVAASFEAPSADNVYLLIGTYLTCVTGSFFTITCFVDSLSRYHHYVHTGIHELSVKDILAATVKLCFRRKQLVIIPITLFYGCAQAFIVADYTEGYVACSHGIENIGYVMVSYGLLKGIIAFVLGWILNSLGSLLVVLTAFLLHVSLLVTLLVWTPEPKDKVVFFVLSGWWGFCDGIWEISISKTINIRYPPQNWLHLYTDGSLISREQVVGAGVTCCLFSLYRSLGYGTTSFDGEIVAITKKGSTATYRPVTKSTYYSVKRFVKSTYLRLQQTKFDNTIPREKWNSLHQNPQLIPDLPRKSSVAAFRLATGHDCLAKHLHRIGIYQSPNCPLCNSNQEMDSEHLKIYASLAGHDNIFEKYWSARGQMTLLSNAWH